ncbi:hypothetical protein DPM13_02905 [Paracoccus mutanolyticus]|uniref:GTA TIM-barrel-like domain-containing protein n=1 Tax=Paracoccus mutanolyticus TaxID=1499308 RepID=A0ABN5M4D1_9RHOB|nr:hypothetical protein DPM13_02905 [Paracoccus mutanolyticus]
MATILLAAAGASIGAGFGGTVLGLSGAVIGRAVGATLGRVIDQKLLGSGSKAVETGRVDRMRIQTAGEGTPIPRIWGQMRVPGHAIWAGPLVGVRRTQGGGGKGSSPSVTEVSYRLSFALALCEGPILGVGRVWADGEEISPDDLNMRVYLGDEAQLPDPAIVAQEGDEAPAYRGIAYVVLEDLGLERWGNRVPQLSFEVTRRAKEGRGLSREVRAVAMIPGTGEYSLATTPVSYDLGLGETQVINRNTPIAGTDFRASLRILGRELPNVGSVSLVVSWFGDDLRVNHCTVRPEVEVKSRDGQGVAWRAGGIGRDAAVEVARVGGRPIYGGTPADGSVIEALRALAPSGRKAVFYPFILMEQLAGNGRADPWTGAADQPVMPWRGRITTSIAADRAGSPAGTAAAENEVAAFFGTARASDFSREGDEIRYSGPDEWSYRRFILHYAHLCAAAGGIDAFLIGSEMVGLTQIQGADHRFPAVEQLIRLAADVRATWGMRSRSAMRRTGRSISAITPATGMCSFIWTRCGATTTSTSWASTTTCRCRTGARARIIWMPPGAGSTIRPICRRTSRGARASTGIMPATSTVRCRSARRSATDFTMSTGSGATRTSAAGGRTSIATASADSAARGPRPGCRARNPSGSPRWAARHWTRARTSPTSSWMR